ncbi:hypothetical protein BJ508DRAFT_414098 [Ascobolus immersus RN42]|uniref:Uncharacterized protein n=1 Tax=Ascobolus immersus RN42 TaxID=1160509 RepID=A0A3N4IE85_ASCIM|nr:hypothetical protein BJ508DRAFT_414098 [Ascobolus immersus RN42]
MPPNPKHLGQQPPPKAESLCSKSDPFISALPPRIQPIALNLFNADRGRAFLKHDEFITTLLPPDKVLENLTILLAKKARLDEANTEAIISLWTSPIHLPVLQHKSLDIYLSRRLTTAQQALHSSGYHGHPFRRYTSEVFSSPTHLAVACILYNGDETVWLTRGGQSIAGDFRIKLAMVRRYPAMGGNVEFVFDSWKRRNLIVEIAMRVRLRFWRKRMDRMRKELGSLEPKAEPTTTTAPSNPPESPKPTEAAPSPLPPSPKAALSPEAPVFTPRAQPPSLEPPSQAPANEPRLSNRRRRGKRLKNLHPPSHTAPVPNPTQPRHSDFNQPLSNPSTEPLPTNPNLITVPISLSPTQLTLVTLLDGTVISACLEPPAKYIEKTSGDMVDVRSRRGRVLLKRRLKDARAKAEQMVRDGTVGSLDPRAREWVPSETGQGVGYLQTGYVYQQDYQHWSRVSPYFPPPASHLPTWQPQLSQLPSSQPTFLPFAAPPPLCPHSTLDWHHAHMNAEYNMHFPPLPGVALSQQTEPQYENSQQAACCQQEYLPFEEASLPILGGVGEEEGAAEEDGGRDDVSFSWSDDSFLAWQP